MTETKARRLQGKLRLSRIAYFTDLARSEVWMIPVGVVAEVTLPEAHGISTALRRSFSDFELGQMAPTVRGMLGSPMDHFWPVMQAALTDAPRGVALDTLLGQYTSALSILPPDTPELPGQWMIPCDAQRVKEQMRVVVTDAYFRFLFSLRDDVADPAIAEDIRGAAGSPR
jgi:hypothetical protein